MKTAIFDNGDVSFDRYTFINEDGDIFGSSEDPHQPQGFGQFCGNIKDPSYGKWKTVGEFIKEAIEDKRLGELIDFKDIPERVQQFIEERR